MIDTSTADNWFLHLERYQHPGCRLFCFPYAGGGASFFSPWAKMVPAGIEIWPVQLPGRQTRLSEKPLRRLSEMVEVLASVIEQHLDVPFAFFGHSMGALISFELARQLRRQHLPLPSHLFLSGRRAPQLPTIETALYELDDTLFLKATRDLNYLSPIFLENRETLQLVLPTLRADFELTETYRYKEEAPLNCTLSILGGTDDFSAPPEDLLAL